MPAAPEQPNLTFLGKLVLALFLGACGYGAWVMMNRDKAPAAPSSGPGATTAPASASTSGSTGSPRVSIGLAYGTEKKLWLTGAVEEFAKTPDAKRIEVKLIPMGSLEGARAAVKGDERINVWSPASAVYREVFVQEWRLQHGDNLNPILKDDLLALSPMVFVGWKERMDAFLKKYGETNFDTVGAALGEAGGWSAIAQKPEWGFFKFGMTDPNKSNSGLLGLVLMAHHFHKKERALELGDIVNADFQTWLRKVATGMNTNQDSTGTLMRDMVLKGPSTYDAALVYENVAIDYLKQAEGRWGALTLSYPSVNIWNDNPYYILDVPWSTPAQRDAAEIFLKFLLSPAMQKRALEHGFRPAEASVSLKEPDSPFVKFAAQGLRIEIPKVCPAPKPEAILNLQEGWQRLRGQ